MGAEPYEYWVEYEEDITSALQSLRQHIFQTGDYWGSDADVETIEEALECAGDGGTSSILDIMDISTEVNYCCAAPFSDEELQAHFGSIRPTRAMIEQQMAVIWNDLDRGQAHYIIAYDEQEQPREILFAGMTFD